MNLLGRLRTLAELWVDYQARGGDEITLRTFGWRAVGNPKLFERDDMKVGTYERAVQFLAEPKSWPAATIPDDAAELIAEVIPGNVTVLA